MPSEIVNGFMFGLGLIGAFGVYLVIKAVGGICAVVFLQKITKNM